MKKNTIKITRVPPSSEDTSVVTVTLEIEFDFADEKAVERLSRVFRELIPEKERAKFSEDLKAAAARAGMPV